MIELLQPAPTAQEVKDARMAVGMSQLEAAQLVGHASYQTWNYWENGHRTIPAASWALFLLATGQHGGYVLRRA